MVDYWVSFATSLDPNDGLGSARKSQEWISPLRMSNQFNFQVLNGLSIPHRIKYVSD